MSARWSQSMSVSRCCCSVPPIGPLAPLQLVGEVCGVWDGRIDRMFLFVLRLDRLPTLQLDNREIIGAQLVPIDDLHKVPLTGPVQAYVCGQF
jgi:hypothetical protein